MAEVVLFVGEFGASFLSIFLEAYLSGVGNLCLVVIMTGRCVSRLVGIWRRKRGKCVSTERLRKV